MSKKQKTVDLGLAWEIALLQARRRRAQAILADAIRSDAEILALAKESSDDFKAKRKSLGR